MKIFNVAIIGATGMVGQRFLTILENHPWFKVKIVAASSSSSKKKYKDAVKGRWKLEKEIPKEFQNLIVLDAEKDKEKIAKEVDFCFCAVNMEKEKIKKLEESYAKLECPVISNNSANRQQEDVPMIIPEINPNHIEIIKQKKKRLKTKKGFIAVKSNCSIQSYVPAISPLLEFNPTKILACTYQAISGAGRTFSDWEEIKDNVIPYIKGEEEKSEKEPLKIWGVLKDGKIENKDNISITTQCLRVPVSDGHIAAVFVSFEKKPTIEQIKEKWKDFTPEISSLNLPLAPKKFLNYFEEQDRPQTKLDRNLEKGMAISIGRLRKDIQYDYKFICLSHNTLRGAAGGAVLMAELLAKKGYFD